MKILWISHLLPFPPVGGARIRSYYLLRELSKYHSIHFIGLYQRAHQSSLIDVNRGIHVLKELCLGVDILPFESFHSKSSWLLLVLKGLLSSESYKVKWCRSRNLEHRIRDILRSERFDLVHFDTISLIQYTDAIPKSTPIVINHHNIESEMLLRRAKNEKFLISKLFFLAESRKIRRLEIEYCPKSLNIVVSELDRERLRKIVPSAPTQVIPNGVDINYFRRQEVVHIAKSLIFVGGLSWYPNRKAVKYFCKKIWPLLVAREAQTNFFIVGKNPPRWLMKFGRTNPNVSVLGFVPDIRPLMSAVDAFVCPMWEGGGTRLKILNAMAMGVPLISTRMACEGIPVENGKHVLFAENPQEFVKQVSRIFKDDKLKTKLSLESMRLIREYYDYRKIGVRMSEAYNRWRTNDFI